MPHVRRRLATDRRRAAAVQRGRAGRGVDVAEAAASVRRVSQCHSVQSVSCPRADRPRKRRRHQMHGHLSFGEMEPAVGVDAVQSVFPGPGRTVAIDSKNINFMGVPKVSLKILRFVRAPKIYFFAAAVAHTHRGGFCAGGSLLPQKISFFQNQKFQTTTCSSSRGRAMPPRSLLSLRRRSFPCSARRRCQTKILPRQNDPGPGEEKTL